MHPGEQRLELTIAQHHTWIGLRGTCEHACKHCDNCAVSKKRDKKCGLLPPKPTPEIIPWHTLCVDLVGSCKFRNEDEPKTHMELHCPTVMDPATGFFEIVEIGEKTANVSANWLEIHWLSWCPWPAEIAVDRGSEFAAEVSKTLKSEHGTIKKIVTSRNPQSNAAVERCHKTLHNVIRSAQTKDKKSLDPFFGFKGLLAACRKAMNSTVHTTLRATPTQLVFSCDATLNASSKQIGSSLRNASRGLSCRTTSVKMPNESHTTARLGMSQQSKLARSTSMALTLTWAHRGRITQAHDNGAVKLVKVANNGGAVSQTWNIWQIEPHTA